MTPSVVVSVQEKGVFLRGTAYGGVPVVVPCSIAIETAGNGEAADWAARIEAELKTVLMGSGPGVTSQDTGDASGSGERLFVLLCAAPVPQADWIETKNTLTVFRSGQSPAEYLPEGPLRAVNAQFWDRSVTECMPAILSLSGLSLPDQRIFISYRRLETQPLADQLFDALTHEGFNVFLDRFSIRPGLDFQTRLNQELADKSMVLFLESARAHTSQWTEHEIQFVKRYQLGMLVLKLPDLDPDLPSTDADFRMGLKKEEFEAAATPVQDFKQWGKLKPEKLTEVIGLAKVVHDRSVFRRRRFLRDNITAALGNAGLQPDPMRPDGLTIVKAGLEYGLWITTRPPEVADFQTPWGLVKPPAQKGVVVGPMAAMETGRMKTLAWLTERCNFACIDPDDVPVAAEKMKDGTL